MRLSLNGTWSLKWCTETKDMPPVDKWNEIFAQVPGNAELDLFINGVEPDPYYAENEYLFRKYEYCAWIYEKRFFLANEKTDERINLVFDGLNCFADIFVNDVKTGSAENALIPHAFDVTDQLIFGGENKISVYIHSALNKARNMDFPVHISANEGFSEYACLRMPPHSFGWDIMPRFLSAGMWRGVRLESVKNTRFTQVYYATLSANEKSAEMILKYRFTTDDNHIDGCFVRVYLDDLLVCEKQAPFTASEMRFTVNHPRLWWPKGYGEANLYTARCELVKDGTVLDSRTENIGIRKVDIASIMKPDDEGEFLIRVNGVRILAKGSNWVPMDAFHSRDAERYEKAISLFNEAGCNILRLWGGNVYEDHAFFDLCDKSGIMVWHDFSMGCAIYPQSPEFLKTIHDECETVIRRMRNHASIILWAGDNEVDDCYTWQGYTQGSNRYNAVTREACARAVRENDPYRPFLPSSPYIDAGVDRMLVPEQHNWGPRAYFKDDFYRLTKAHFVSECGYHGCPAKESLQKFIPEDELWPMSDKAWKTHNAEYRKLVSRGYDRNDLMARQVRIMVGQMPETLDDFILFSQFTQAEAKKYFIESTRIHKWRRTGIIWWNMIDGWPQISDAVVDWYYVKKRAFNAIKHVQTPVCIMLDEHNAWGHRVVLGNDSNCSHEVSYRLINADTSEVLLEGKAFSPKNENITLGEISLLPGMQTLVLIEWMIDKKRFTNHYLTGHPPYDMEKVRAWSMKIDKWNND